MVYLSKRLQHLRLQNQQNCMAEENKKVVLATRVFQRIKDKLNERASESETTLSNYTEKVLKDYCDNEDNDCVEGGYKTTIDHLTEEIKSLRSENEDLKNSVQDFNKNSIEQESLYSEIESLKEVNGHLKRELATIESLTAGTDFCIKLVDSERFRVNIEYLQSKYPQFSLDQLVELSVVCSSQNMKNRFFVNNLTDYLISNPDFFTSQTTPHATSDL